MIKYEYEIISSAEGDDIDVKLLNTLGEEGWELVSAISDVRSTVDENDRICYDMNGDEITEYVTVFYFKRPRD
jgi:hypothetical protein